MADTPNILPAHSIPVLDTDANVFTLPWRRYFQSVTNGSTSGVTPAQLAAVAAVAQEALTDAELALSEIASITAGTFGFAYNRSLAGIQPLTTMVRFEAGIAWSILPSAPGSSGQVDTAPTVDTLLPIFAFGQQVGNIIFQAASTTALFDIGAISLGSTDTIEVHVPSTLNGMAGLLNFTLLGTR